MDRFGLRDLVTPFYSKNRCDCRLDHAERIETIVTRWQKEISNEEEIDADLLVALAYSYSIIEDILKIHRVRLGFESWFVEQGWGNARIRGFMRAAVRLPTGPKSVEEKLVADADTVCRLGLLGLSRSLLRSGAQGESLEDAIKQSQQDLYRRAFTAPGQSEIVPLKGRLRDLLEELRRINEPNR